MTAVDHRLHVQMAELSAQMQALQDQMDLFFHSLQTTTATTTTSSPTSSPTTPTLHPYPQLVFTPNPTPTTAPNLTQPTPKTATSKCLLHPYPQLVPTPSTNPLHEPVATVAVPDKAACAVVTTIFCPWNRPNIFTGGYANVIPLLDHCYTNHLTSDSLPVGIFITGNFNNTAAFPIHSTPLCSLPHFFDLRLAFCIAAVGPPSSSIGTNCWDSQPEETPFPVTGPGPPRSSCATSLQNTHPRLLLSAQQTFRSVCWGKNQSSRTVSIT